MIPRIGSMEMAIVCVVVRGDSIDCSDITTGAVEVLIIMLQSKTSFGYFLLESRLSDIFVGQ